MGMHPRWIKPNTAYAQTQRTVDRQYLFKPDDTVRNIIGACAARAQETHPVVIYWLEFNINHEHNGIAAISDSPKHLNNVIMFKKTFHRLLAEEINRLLKREGSIFSTPPRTAECLDDMSLEQQFFYALTNPVKDGLVDRVTQWGGFSSYKALAKGEVERFTFYDRTAWHKAGGENSKKPIQSFAKIASVEYTPLPAWAGMSDNQRQAHIRRETRKLEQQFREMRSLEGKTAMGPARLARVDHRDRPSSHPPRTRKPICHASSPERAREYNRQFKEFLNAYREASAHYRGGDRNVEFPAGSIKPPLIHVCVPGCT